MTGEPRGTATEMPSGLPPTVDGTVVTVGTFDGVHLGHRAILEEIARRARSRDLRSVLLTFDRHPLRVVRPDDAPPLLTTPNEKKEILAQYGLDYVAFVSFTLAFSRYSPREFVEEVLVRRLRARELVIGHDHGFGRGRSGDVGVLESLGAEHGFAVDVVSGIEAAGGVVSSTRIRAAIAEGRVEDARAQLGRPYSLRGTVIHGMGRGRTLGFPTANISPPPPEKLLPAEGIYAVRASIGSELCRGLLHLGPRPTFAGSPPTIELYVLDFERDVYGERVVVEFLKKLRDVAPFASAGELVDQMKEDREHAIRYFQESGPGGA
ncbi:MAG: bifunctional riboflavin kinase/FAD synthetase [Gemmatimonadota bacterium]|nr:bifunctional riboflavin kinase/FAD synthetase [Gemmatimonadota bacterium]